MAKNNTHSLSWFLWAPVHHACWVSAQGLRLKSGCPQGYVPFWRLWGAAFSSFIQIVGRIHFPISSFAQSCPILCDPMDCSIPGFPVPQQLPELAQTHVHPVSGHAVISSSVVPFSSCLQSFPASGSFPMSQFFTSVGQSIAVSASASVFLMSIQG